EAHHAHQREHDEQQHRGDRVADAPGRDVHSHGVLLAGPADALTFAGAASTTRTRSPSARKAAPEATTRACGSSPPMISTRSPARRPTLTLVSATRESGPTRMT